GGAPRDDDVQSVVARGRPDEHLEGAVGAVGLLPAGGEAGAARLVDQRQLVGPLGEADGGGAGLVGQRHRRGVGEHAAAARAVGGQLAPPHVGQGEVVDVGADGGDQEVPGEHRPVVPPLVAPVLAVEVGPVQGPAGPAGGVGVEVHAVGGAQVDGCR